MGYPFKSVFMGLCAVAFVLTGNGCLSYRMLREVKGSPVLPPVEKVRIGSTTIGEVLAVYGAPSRVVELSGRDFLVYERTVFCQNSIAFGIPISDLAGSSVSLSGYTNLTRYDTLALVFTPNGVLEDVVYEQGSTLPYMETLFKGNLK